MTQAELHRILDYDPATGIFTWKHRPEMRKVWNARYANTPAGCRGTHGYRIIKINRSTYKAHRLAWLYVYGEWPQQGKEIDHRNGGRSDNRIENLRVVTRSVNLANLSGVKKNNRSGHTGVYRAKGERSWRADIQANRKRVYLGRFVSFRDAVAARKVAEREYFPEVFA